MTLSSENELGNLITSLIHKAIPTLDVVILNTGLFRTAWTPGILKYFHLYNMFPFNNHIVSVDMTGKELL